MARLLVFLSLILGLVLVLSLNGLKNLPVKNEYFNISNLEKEHEEKVKLAELSHAESAQGHGSEGGEKSTGEAGEEEEAAPVVVAEVKIPLDTPELQSGYDIYHTKAKCTTCHGKNGEGRKSQKAPKLGGQYDWYLFEQLVNIKNKVRVNKVMDPYLKNLSEKDLKDVAIYLSKLPFP